MRAFIPRTSQATGTVDGKTVGKIGHGLVILLGIKNGDTEKDIDTLVNKIVNLRVFAGDGGHFDRSLLEMNNIKSEGATSTSRLQDFGVLIVSQFTLYGSTKKGRRPDFADAAKPEISESLYELFVKKMSETGITVATGVFGAMMDVHLINEGPVTFIIET